MKVSILGYGNMGKAIAKALAKKSQVAVFDQDKKTTVFAPKIKTSDFIIIAVKPKDIQNLANEVSPHLNPNCILVSIAAGTTLKNLNKFFKHKKIVRVMPNLGLTVGQGIAAWKSAGLAAAEKAKAKKFLDLWTENFEVATEDQIDKVTAISGSGPAYFFLLAWCLEQAARALGFNEKQSRMLVEKTFAGAALLQKHGDYELLIKKVMSKKGTTEAAFKVFKKSHFNKIVKAAAQAAYKRAKQISHGK